MSECMCVRAHSIASSCSRNWKPTSLAREQAPVTRPGQERLAVVAAIVSSIHPITRCFTPSLGFWKTGRSFPERYAYPERVCSDLEASPLWCCGEWPGFARG